MLMLMLAEIMVCSLITKAHPTTAVYSTVYMQILCNETNNNNDNANDKDDDDDNDNNNYYNSLLSSNSYLQATPIPPK